MSHQQVFTPSAAPKPLLTNMRQQVLNAVAEQEEDEEQEDEEMTAAEGVSEGDSNGSIVVDDANDEEMAGVARVQLSADTDRSSDEEGGTQDGMSSLNDAGMSHGSSSEYGGGRSPRRNNYGTNSYPCSTDAREEGSSYSTSMDARTADMAPLGQVHSNVSTRMCRRASCLHPACICPHCLLTSMHAHLQS